MAVGEARPGYELWRPNRQKSASTTTRFLAIVLLVASIALMLIVTLGGWSLLLGGSTWGVVTIVFCGVYGLLAWMVSRWSRGALSLAIALSVLILAPRRFHLQRLAALDVEHPVVHRVRIVLVAGGWMGYAVNDTGPVLIAAMLGIWLCLLPVVLPDPSPACVR